MFLVTGATGGLGRRIVRLLRDRNQSVRAFVRLTSRYAELEHRGAEIFIGDLRHSPDIRRACQGVRYIISAHGSSNEAVSGTLAVDYRANIELIDCAKALSVEHMVFISVMGSDLDYEDAPVFKAKRAIERYLQTSGLNHTILRPSGFASNLLPLAERFRQTGLYLLIGDPQHRASILSTDDLARIAVASIHLKAAHNQILSISGPQVLKREEIPHIFGRVFNREPIILNPPLFVFDGLRGVLNLFNQDLGASLGTLRTLLANEFFCTPTEIAQLETTFGFRLETLETFLCRYLGV